MAEILAAPPAVLMFLAVFVGSMLTAAIYDLATYTIPNFLSLVVIAGFAGWAFWAGLAWDDIGLHFGVGLFLLLIGWVMFILGMVGGGDAKFMASTGLWYGWPDIVHYLIAFSLAGGALALIFVIYRRAPLPGALARISWLTRLHDSQKGLPYGVALCAGALLALPASLSLGGM